MGLKLSSQQRQLLLDWARQAGDHECCGLLLGRAGVVQRAELTPNVAQDSTAHFEIDPSALIHAEKSARSGGPQIVGYFHSHPNGDVQPSATDARMAAADGRVWLIIAAGEISSWRPEAAEPGEPVTFRSLGRV
jgi:desampylase